MAVSTDNAFSGPYVANGVTTVFPFTFTAPTSGEAAVEVRDASGALIPAPSHTSIINSGAGGSIVFSAPPPAGFTVTPYLDPAFTQDLQFENGSAWAADPVNEGYDRSALRDQVLKRDAARGLKVPIGSTGYEVGSIAPGQVLGFVSGKLQGIDNNPGASEEAAERSEDARDAAIEARAGSEVARDASAASAGASSSSAAASAGSASAAGGYAGNANTSAGVAQGYADDAAIAAATAPNVYPNTAAGVAAVANGNTFWVATSPGTLSLYRRNGSAADFIMTQQSVGTRIPRIVDDYGARDSILAAERFPGLLVRVVKGQEISPGVWRALWFECDPDTFNPASPPSGNTGWRPAPEFVNNWVAFRSSPIIDDGRIYFPAFYVLRNHANGYGTLYTPTAPNAYVSSPIQMGVGVRRHVFDQAIYDATGSLEAAIVEVDDATSPLRDTNTQAILAVTTNGRLIDSRDYTFVGDVPGGSVPNQFRYGRQVDDAPYVFPGVEFGESDPARCYPVDITDPDLLALGFTRGISGPAGQQANFGGFVDRPIRKGDHYVAHFYMHSTVPGSFGQPRTYISKEDRQADFGVPNVLAELNPNVREFYIVGRVENDGIGRFTCGTDNSGGAATITVTGIRINFGASARGWISSTDYPEPLDASPLLPDMLFAVSGRPLPIYPANALKRRGLPASVAMYVPSAYGGADQSVVIGGGARGKYEIDPAAIDGQSLSITTWADEEPTIRYNKVLPCMVKTVPLSGGAPWLVIGDSHSAYDDAPGIYVNRLCKDLQGVLASWGYDITFVGTLETGIDDNRTEGRASWSLKNHMGFSRTLGVGSYEVWTSAVGAGQPAMDAYLASDFNTRFRTNPYLSNAGGSAAPIIPGAVPLLGGGTATGLRYDLVSYKDRAGIGTVGGVLINLGSNDMNIATGLDDIAAYFPAFLAEVRRAFPGVPIIVWMQAPAYQSLPEIQWARRRQGLQTIIKAVRARRNAGDTLMHFCGAYMHHAIDVGFTLTAGVIDPDTGVRKAQVQDFAHLYDPVAQQAHEAVAAAIANFA